MNKIEATPAVNPALAEHAARFSRKIVKTGERTHTLIGYNVANVSVIEAPEGLILVDGMAQENSAREAAADIAERFPGQPIRAVVYTHFHNDHVNGIEGFISQQQVASGEVEIWAHADLMHFVTEVSAGMGPIMGRRAAYTFGAALPRGRLTRDEYRRYGSTALRLYAAYFKHAGGVAWTGLWLALGMNVQVLSYLQTLYLARWVVCMTGAGGDDDGDDDDGAVRSARAQRLMATYMALVGATLVNTALRAATNAAGMLRASKRVHDAMLSRVLRAPAWWFDATPLGRVLNRFSSDLASVDSEV